ncbi:unnamed protein product [Spirodela intermedia]|uniref:Uncharacterized protein n=2 Tax=Spirodela intermedia TaxID=51605 RepID=A0A7I8JX66_SPIIN|nr:unnamed protein product [Spirodela intermedia]CAA6653990.1 unnamed protein product [Spirodela intermedia]CAA7388431.1 unnamed protein product [Spirodela intermedia]
MAVTMSPSAALRAFTAFPRDTPAWVITSSMSLGSTPDSSTSSSSWAAAAAADDSALERTWLRSAVLNCSAACVCSCELRSSIFASPKIT